MSAVPDENRAAERSGTDRRAVIAPARAAAERNVPERVLPDLPAERSGTKPARRNAAFRRIHAAARARPRGTLSTIAAAQQVRRLKVRPTDLLFVYRARRFCQWLNTPAGTLVFVAVCSGTVWVLWRNPQWIQPASWVGLAVVTFLAGWAGWGIADGLVRWPHRSRWVNELGYSLRALLDLSPDIPAAKFVQWPPDFGDEGTEMRITLPRGYVGTDDDRAALLRAVREIGGFEADDLNHKFILAGRFSYVRFTPREKLMIPQLVRANDPEVMELLEQVRSGRHLLALGKGFAHILGDLDGDAPHVGISMRTGKGKSNQLKGIIAQEMHLGASVVILDLKRRSLKCFKGLPGVVYCRTVAEIHSALVDLYKEADHRNVLADTLGDDEEPPWQRRLVVMEEQNTTIDALNDYWAEIREPGDPRVSPAVRAYRAIGNMGRQVNVHILAVFQKLTAQAAGGTTARDNFGMVIMSGFKPSAWRMLAEELPMPSIKGKPKGRNWYICDGEAHEGQSLLWTDKAAREWAASGEPSDVRAYVPRGSRTSAYQGKRPANVAGIPETTHEQERLYTVREASWDKGHGIVTFTHQSLRGQRVTDPEFPDPDAIDGQKKLYRAETLRRWEANRERAPT